MLIPIGQFSTMVRLSVKAFRLYADRGLLLPAYSDPETSYRYYRASQARRAEIIRILRSVDMSLTELETGGEVEVCIPVQNTFASSDGFPCHRLEDDHLATIVHFGPYEELSSAYHSMLAWIAENAYQLGGSPREIYLNDPGMVSSDKLQTRLEFPVTQCPGGDAGK